MKIKCPTLIVNAEICKANIRRMAEKAKHNQVEFRPHFKTHQSLMIGRWFREFGVDKITVSSVQMAEFFANDGWDDITIAFPVNMLEIDEINHLAKQIRLNVLVESRKVLRFLEEHLRSAIGVFVKIDAGYHRTGIPVENTDEISALLDCFKGLERCKFNGFLTHNGHTYKAQSIEEIEQIHFTVVKKMNELKDRFIHQFPDLILSLGDTPSMSVLDNFGPIDEIRPGNFVFYDLMQSELGVCKEEDIAVVVACPVVAKHQDRKQMVIYGGAVHLSKEMIRVNHKTVFGKMQLLDKNLKWNSSDSGNYIISLSQEHGVIQVDENIFNTIKLGDLVGVLPVHSCLAANLLDRSDVVIL